MALYAYKAMNAAGRRVLGRMDAANPLDLEMRLKRVGLDFIQGAPVRQRTGFGNRVPRRELINFCFHLEQLVRVGVPIVESLADLRDSVAPGRLHEILTGMVESVTGGKPLSHAMAEHPDVFDDVVVSLVRAGEDTGRLPEVLGNIVTSLKWQDELAAHTRRLLMYPSFLAVVMAAVLLFMMTYLVPKMVGFMKNMGQALPLQTEILIAVSNVFSAHWHLMLLALIAMALAVNAAIRLDARARYAFDAVKLHIPLAGDILRKIILARFAGTFAMLYGSGITVLDAIAATENVVDNAVVKAGLQQAGRRIAEGGSVTAAFQETGIFPPLVIRMLRIGENTGALDTALVNVGYFYNRDVRESVERGLAMLEPTVTVMIGVVMGWIMLSVLGPIYDVITRLKT